MRNLVPCTFEAGTRTIHIPLHEMTGVENIRLIVNETQKVVICSSMQKDNITSCVKDNVNGGWDVTFDSDVPALASGDVLTVEIDLGLGDKFFIDGTDTILKAKADGISGTPFVIGPELADKIIEGILMNKDNSYTAAAMFANTSVEEVELSLDEPIGYVNGLFAFAYMFQNCPKLTRAVFNVATHIGMNGLVHTFDGCPVLSYLDIGSIQYDGSGSNLMADMLTGNKSLETLICDINLLGGWAVTLNRATLVHFTSTYNANRNISFSNASLLDFASIKNILEHCANVNMSGKTITFYSNGLTIQDDADGTLQTLYDSVVNTYQANIANLTITPYSA